MTTLGSRLHPQRYLDSLEREGEALAAAAADNLRAEVSPCPGWDVADLVWHVGGVHHFWGSVARGQIQNPKEVTRPARPDDDGLLRWYRDNLRATVSTLRAADPTATVWTWTRENNVAWIRRRMAQETSVHRWDAQSARGTPTAIDTDIAVDGIDELLEFFIEDAAGAPDLSVHLHATDAEGEWLATVKDGRLHVGREHAKGDVAVRGTASDLLLLLWGRVPEADVEVHGDRAVLFAFLRLADLD